MSGINKKEIELKKDIAYFLHRYYPDKYLNFENSIATEVYLVLTNYLSGASLHLTEEMKLFILDAICELEITVKSLEKKLKEGMID